MRLEPRTADWQTGFVLAGRPLLPGPPLLGGGFLKGVHDLLADAHPDGSRWVRAVVESTLTRDRSVLPWRAASAITPSGNAVKSPASLQTRKRPWTVAHGPNSPGISRHWLVRNRQITPSNCFRSRAGYGRIHLSAGTDRSTSIACE